jgi:hypothetical protein
MWAAAVPRPVLDARSAQGYPRLGDPGIQGQPELETGCGVTPGTWYPWYTWVLDTAGTRVTQASSVARSMLSLCNNASGPEIGLRAGLWPDCYRKTQKARGIREPRCFAGHNERAAPTPKTCAQRERFGRAVRPHSGPEGPPLGRRPAGGPILKLSQST